MSIIKVTIGKKQQKALEKLGLELVIRGQYQLPNNIKIEPRCRLRVLPAGRLFEVGAFSLVQTHYISELSNVKIGRYCSIALRSNLNIHSHPTDWLSTSDFQYTESFFGKEINTNSDNLKTLIQRNLENGFDGITEIGNDVWVGEGALIKAGVKIGDGAIIGGSALITKDVPPYAIVGGVPGKIIRFRFSEKIIEKLLQLKWWEYCYEDLSSVNFAEIEKAIDQIEDLKAKGIQKYQPRIITEKDFLQFQSLSKKIKNFWKS